MKNSPFKWLKHSPSINIYHQDHLLIIIFIFTPLYGQSHGLNLLFIRKGLNVILMPKSSLILIVGCELNIYTIRMSNINSLEIFMVQYSLVVLNRWRSSHSIYTQLFKWNITRDFFNYIRELRNVFKWAYCIHFLSSVLIL